YDGLADRAERVVGVAADAERAFADAGARLAAGARREEERDPGAEQRAEEEPGNAAGAALHNDPGQVVVLGHDSSFGVAVGVGRSSRGRGAQRAAAGSAT